MFAPVEPVTDVLHGVSVTDHYRWLEDQDSPRTRQWIAEQTQYARGYLDHLPGRQKIRERIREFLAVGTYDSLQKTGSRYFFGSAFPTRNSHAFTCATGPMGKINYLPILLNWAMETTPP